MYISHILSMLIAASTIVVAVSEVWTDATSFGAMLERGDSIAKRQGYTPEQRTCGRGNSCQEACGASYVQCPSTDSRIHCHNPSTGTHCCTDGTGNACRAGYYCTTDGRGRTYCCPDGIDNAACAVLYSLTISLMRGTSVLALPSASSIHVSLPAPTSVLLTTSSPVRATPSASHAASSSIRPFGRNSTSVVVPSSKVNATSTTSQVPEFTGGAMKVAGAGIMVFAGAARLLL